MLSTGLHFASESTPADVAASFPLGVRLRLLPQHPPCSTSGDARRFVSDSHCCAPMIGARGYCQRRGDALSHRLLRSNEIAFCPAAARTARGVLFCGGKLVGLVASRDGAIL
jgi:hypothetical protein